MKTGGPDEQGTLPPSHLDTVSLLLVIMSTKPTYADEWLFLKPHLFHLQGNPNGEGDLGSETAGVGLESQEEGVRHDPVPPLRYLEGFLVILKSHSAMSPPPPTPVLFGWAYSTLSYPVRTLYPLSFLFFSSYVGYMLIWLSPLLYASFSVWCSLI